MQRFKGISVKWIMFATLLVFAAILLIILWLFQTVYLEKFYTSIKMKEIEKAMGTVEEGIKDDDIDSTIEVLASSYDICVMVTDIEGKVVSDAEADFKCAIHKWSDRVISLYINRLIANDGEYSAIIDTKGSIRNQNSERNYDNQSDFFDMNVKKEHDITSKDGIPSRLKEMPDVSEYKSAVYLKLVEDSDGVKKVIILNSIISPVDATVQTIKVQLIYVSLIMILIAILLALVISKIVSKPIIKLNASAKELAKGNFNIKFEASEYQEVEELSNTLNHAAVDLGKAEALQRELLANVSHDLRTPLTMIIGYSEVMRDLPGENTPENVQVVIDEATRLTNLVNDLLDISKIQSGVAEINKQRFDITESIKNTIERYTKLVEQEGYKVVFEYSQNVIIYADEFKLNQVVYNLINNAITYTGEDKTVKVLQKIIGEVVRIEIIDSGEGIAESELNNVWQRYYKVDNAHKRAKMGSGIGLSIVESVLNLHGTKYGVNSKVGKGSTFWFEFKL